MLRRGGVGPARGTHVSVNWDGTDTPSRYDAEYLFVDPNAMFPPALLAKAKVVKRCHHPRAKRVAGPRVKARWGSWATELCGHCWAWRYDRGASTLACKGDRFWRGLDELARLLDDSRWDEA